MGADHRGPLAAFVVIAVIAAILLITSVRSQAAPGWLTPGGLPASVVAGPSDSDLFLVVEQGAALVERATVDPSRAQGDPHPTTPAAPASPRRASVPHGTRHATPSSDGAPHKRSIDSSDPAPTPTRHDHGRHLGWGHGYGQGHGRHVGWSHRR